MVINAIIDLDNGELLEATGKHRISALDIQGSETAELKFTFYKNGSAVTDNSVVSGAVIDFGVKADANYTGTSYLIYHDTFSASSDGLTYSATPTWATSEVETALGNESSVKLHGQVKVVISGITYYSQVFEVEIHNNVIQAAGTTNSVIFPRLIQSASDPTVNDDSLDGYGVSSLWLNTSTNAVHVLMDNAAGAAVWAGFLGLTNGQLANNLIFNDDLKAVFGTSSDGLEIYHSSDESYIDDSGTGRLFIRSNGSGIFLQKTDGENLAKFKTDGATELYFDGSKKLESTNLGCTVTGKLIVSGDLDVDGTTTTFNSTVVTVDDPVFGIGGDTAPGSQDNKDRGVSFRYHDGASAKVGFFGWDNSENAFTFLTDTNDDSTEVFSGTLGSIKVGGGTVTGTLYVGDSIDHWGDGGTGLSFPSNDVVAFKTSGTEAARFDSSGRFKINNNAPVLQFVESDATATFNTSEFSLSGGSLNLNTRDSSGTFVSTDYQISKDANGATAHKFFIQGTEAARFDSSGRFAIGETTPSAYDGDADDLIVKTGGNTGISIRTSSTGTGSIFFADGISGSERYQGNIRYFHSDNSLRFATSATEAARFDSSGKFIAKSIELDSNGADSPTLKVAYDANNYLEFAHNRINGVSSGSHHIAFQTGGTQRARLDSTGLGIGGTANRKLTVFDTNYRLASFERTSGTNGYIVFKDENTTQDVGIGATTNDLKFRSGNVDHMVLDSSGNLGIGGTPNTNLTVSSSGANGIEIAQDQSAATLSGRLFFTNNNSNQGCAIYNSAGTLNFSLGANPDTTSGGSSMFLSSTGLGIGGAPSAFLHVSKDNDNSGNQFCVADTEGTSAAVRTYTHGGDPQGLILNHYYALAGSGNEYMRYADIVSNVGNGAGTAMRFITKNAANTYSTTIIDNEGRMGIGGTAQSKLHVSSGDIRIDNNQGYLAETAGGGVITAAKMDGSDNLLIGDGNFVIDITGSSELMRLNSTGLGIGVTPSAKLDLLHSQTQSGSTAVATILSNATTTATSTQSSAMYKIQNYLNLTGTGGSFQNSVHQQVMTTVSSTGTATNFKNHVSRVHSSGSGEILNTSHYNVHAELAGSGTIAKWIGYSIADGVMSSFENTGHTITNTYGLYIGDLTSGTQTNTPYGVYQANTDMINYFGGSIGIGGTPSSYKLQLGSAGDKIGVDLSSGGVTRLGEIEFYNSSDGSLNVKTHNASTGGINFHTQGTQRLTVARDGNVGIGTTGVAIDQKLHVKGDAIRLEQNSGSRHIDIMPAVSGVNHRFTSDSTSAGYNFENNGGVLAELKGTGDLELYTDGKGLILSSPDGTRYKITVANDGTVTSSAA